VQDPSLFVVPKGFVQKALQPGPASGAQFFVAPTPGIPVARPLPDVLEQGDKPDAPR
jgi:hypothetical protein